MTISASEVRQIVREELAKALHPSVLAPRFEAHFNFKPLADGPVREIRVPQPRPGHRFVADGQGGFNEEPIQGYDPREDDTYPSPAVGVAVGADTEQLNRVGSVVAGLAFQVVDVSGEA